MRKIKTISTVLLCAVLAVCSFGALLSANADVVAPATELTDADAAAPEAYGPTPSEAQMKYYKDELAAFVHFSMSTFNGKEWSDGTDDPDVFNPTAMDTDQWVKTFKDAGFKRVIITAKHHDGFNIYPTKVTDYSVASSSWMNGEGDVLKAVSDSCKKYGMDMGVYLSPWDQNLPSYTTDVGPDYNDTYIAQMKEIFENYGGADGTITEFWMDGACGSMSTRPIYDIQRWWDTLFELNPDIVFQQNYGAPLRWVGNESGYASEESWQTINKDYIWNLYAEKGQEDAGYLHVGAPYTGKEADGKNNGTIWSVPEVDVSIRSGWFYKDSQSPKNAEQLAKIYFESVGRGSPLLLNVPPDKRGLLADEDIESLKGFREILDNTFSTDYLASGSAEASEVRGNAKKFSAENVTDGDYDTYWTMDDGKTTGSVTVTLDTPSIIDVIEVQEYIPLGQRIKSFDVEVYSNGVWMDFGSGKTVGYKRLLQGSPLLVEKVRVTVTDSLAVPLINNISAYKADERIAEKPKTVPGRIEAESFDEKYGEVDIEKGNGENGSDNLGWIGDGDYTVYKNVMFDATPVSFTLSYGSEKESPEISVRLDSVDGPLLATVTASPTGSYFTYKQANADVAYDGTLEGYHDLYLCMNSGLNIDWFEFNAANTFTISPASVTVYGGDTAELTITRSGGDFSSEASVKVEAVPGTAVVDQCYEDVNETIVFAAGEREKKIAVTTKESHYDDNGDIYFNIVLKEPSDNASVGYESSSEIIIKNKQIMPDRIQAVDYDEGSSNLLKENKGPDGGTNIGALQNGNYVLYKNLYFGATPSEVKICYTGGNTVGAGPTITFRLGGSDGEVLAVCETRSLGNWTVYETDAFATSYAGSSMTGVYDIYVQLNAGINIAWFEFVE